jgi:hypothetical protein
MIRPWSSLGRGFHWSGNNSPRQLTGCLMRPAPSARGPFPDLKRDGLSAGIMQSYIDFGYLCTGEKDPDFVSRSCPVQSQRLRDLPDPMLGADLYRRLPKTLRYTAPGRLATAPGLKSMADFFKGRSWEGMIRRLRGGSQYRQLIHWPSSSPLQMMTDLTTSLASFHARLPEGHWYPIGNRLKKRATLPKTPQIL